MDKCSARIGRDFEARVADLLSLARIRFLAYGSSNTERYLPGMHWFDCIHLGFTRKYGKIGHFLNTGSGGDTTRDLLHRFEQDAGFFKPHFVFLTIGGNDSRIMSIHEFETNLHLLHGRFEELGTQIIFQTYYAPDSTPSIPHTEFYAFTEVVRHVAAETKSLLVDNLKRWIPMRTRNYAFYKPLMLDDFHLNERGNKVMGFDIARRLGCSLAADAEHWGEAMEAQKYLESSGG